MGSNILICPDGTNAVAVRVDLDTLNCAQNVGSFADVQALPDKATGFDFQNKNKQHAKVLATCTGTADVLVSETGVTSPNAALSAADGTPAELHESNDQLVLDLTDELIAGASYTIVWKRSGLLSDPEIVVEESADGNTWTGAAGSPFTVGVTSYINQNIIATTNTRYIRITNTNDRDLEVDAIVYTDANCVGTTASNPPADYLISNLDGQTTNACSGVFADSGDTNANYSDNETMTTTFCSDANNHISFTFEHFNTEAGNDILNIYDGTTTGDPLIGAYSGFGQANSPGVVTSSGTCLTFQFNSNASTNSLGWIASISCTGSPPPGAAAVSWNGYPTNAACGAATDIGGIVYEDIDNDGVQDNYEPPMKGIAVSLYDDNGQVGTTVTTDGNGAYTFSGLTASTVYRVEFTVPDEMGEGPFGAESGTAVQFVESGRCDASLGLVDAEHYCNDTNPYWAIPCFSKGDPQHSSNVGATGVARFRYTDSGNSPTATYTNYVTIEQIGTVWGAAYHRPSNRLFMSASLKRHAGLGPGGIGAIYSHQDGDANNSASVFYDFGAAAGVVADNATRFPGTGTSFGEEGPCGACDNIDPTTFSQVGKVGFGDIEYSSRTEQLYVSNLFDRKIYTIDANNPAPGSAAPLPGIPWLDNSPCSNGVARPWALEWRRGKLFVGVVCDASTSSCDIGSACSDLTATIYSFDGTTWTNEMSFPLDYYRQAYSLGADYFVRWIDDWNVMKPFVENKTDANFAQPVIMDIEFDDDNSMIIGVGDRSAYQLGYMAPPPVGPAGSTAERNFVYGDILRAAYDNASGTFVLENNGRVGSLTTTNPTANTGPGGKSFYWGDYWVGIGANKWQSGIGSLGLLPGSGEVMFPIGDAVDYYSNGLIWMSNTNGRANRKIEIYQGVPDGNSSNFTKSAGVGDIELFCDPPPVEIGNIVWWDDDLDGLQDPGEPGIANVLLELWLDPDGNTQGNMPANGDEIKVATTTTDAFGRYIFSYNGNANGLNAEDWSFSANDKVLTDTFYQIRIPSWATNSEIAAHAAALGYAAHVMAPTQNQTGITGAGGPERDNNSYDNPGTAAGAVATRKSGENDHEFDFGFGGVGGCEAPESIPAANTPCEGETLNLASTVSGGMAPYSFNWSGPNGFTSALQAPSISAIDSALHAGTYHLTVTDGLGCADTVHIDVAVNKISLLNAPVDAACGATDGTIDLTINGFPPYVIDWDNDGTGDNDDDEDLSGLGAGNYNVTVFDADGCQESTTASVGSIGSATLTETHVDETCTSANGSIDLTISGAFTTINWSNGATTEDLSGLSAGTYNLTVNNAANCPAFLSVTINDTPGPVVAAAKVDENCGTANGSIDLTITGGTAPYTFDWDNDGTGDNDDPQNLTGLAAGTYNVTVTDGSSCTATTAVTINNIPGPALSATSSDETCSNANGSIDLTVTGGAAPYTFDWDYDGTGDNNDPEDISGITAGTYNVTVTDAIGCTATTSASFVNIAGPTLSVTPVNSTNCNSADGSIDLTINGGSAPFVIDWNNDGSGDNDDPEDLTGLPSGSYTVQVTDSNGCVANISTSVLNSSTPVLSLAVTDPVSCADLGDIDLTITSGNGPFTFDWDNDGTGDHDDTEDLTGLPGGNYTVIVTDADGCTAQASESVRIIRAPAIDAVVTDVACGASDGTITLSISDPDGGAPYTFDWDNDGVGDNDDTQNLTGLPPGIYNVTITNSINCVETATYSISSPAAPSLVVNQTNPTCSGSNGAIDITIAGGTTPYIIDWDNDGTGDNDDTEDQANLSAGIYNLTVTDNMGCQEFASVELISSELPVLSGTTTPDNCGNGDGTIDLTISGIAPFTIDWDNDGTGDNDDPEDLTGLAAGNYSVTVTDFNGCTSSDINHTFTIETSTAPALTDMTDESICEGESFTASNVTTSVTNAVPVAYQWYDNNGANNTGTAAIPGQTTATLTALPTAAGAYSYRVEATNTDNGICTASEIVNLSIHAASSSVENHNGCTNDNYSITVNGTIYDENNPTGTETIIGGDVNGCDSVVNINLVFNDLPGIGGTPGTAAATDATCSGTTSNNDGTITLTGFSFSTERYDMVTGSSYTGTATFATATAIPADGIISNTLPNPTGTQDYTVRIFTSNDCYIDRTVTLTETACGCNSPALTNLANESICEGESFTASNITTSVTNAVPVTYQWYDNNGTNNTGTAAIAGQTGSALTALPIAPGVYSYRVEATSTDDNSCIANRTVTLTIHALTSGTESYTGCSGDGYSVTVNGTIYDESNTIGTEVIPGGNTNGCDSTVTISLTFHTLPSGVTATVTEATCSGVTPNSDGTITLSGFTGEKYDMVTGSSYTGTATFATATIIPGSGIIASTLPNPVNEQYYTIRVFSSDDCYVDRTVVLTETDCSCVVPAMTDLTDETICEGGSFTPANVTTSITNGVPVTYQWYDNNGLDNPGTAALGGATSATLTTLPATAGYYAYRVEATSTDNSACVSNKLVTLIIYAPSSGTESYTGCSNDGYSVMVNGTIYDESNASGTEVINGGDKNGCDSTVTVNLVFNALPDAGISAAATDATCNGTTPNSDGTITLSGFNFTTQRYDLVTGSSYTGTAIFSTATAIPSDGIITNTLPNPTASQDYTVRVFNSNNCYIDRTVTLTETVCSGVDWGDLPDLAAGTGSGNYETLLANSGPSHSIIAGLYLGTTIDNEIDGQASANADGEGPDDDGLAFPATMQINPGGTLNIPLFVTNTTTNTAHLEMWVDWNGDGDFADTDEMVADLDDGTTTFPDFISVNIPRAVVQGQSLGLRIRLSNEDNMTPYGAVASGEVEDYLIEVNCGDDSCLQVDSVVNPN